MAVLHIVLWHDAFVGYPLDKWELFKKYNDRDVQVEIQIQECLKNYPVPDFVWDEYHLDQQINERGIMIDQGMVREALRIDELSKTDLTVRMQKKNRAGQSQLGHSDKRLSGRKRHGG